MNTGRWHRFWIRLTHWEFWPTWVVYLPVLCCYPLWALRAGSFYFYANVNPGMAMGGLYGASKKDTLDALPDSNKPATLAFEQGTPAAEVASAMKARELAFPVIVKPDQGERGKGIELVHDKAHLDRVVPTHPTPFLVQPYLDLPFEAGVFYVRMPGEPEGQVTSLVVKGFLTVVGNGKDTVEALAKANKRALLVWSSMKGQLAHEAQRVLAEGETLVLESIGNHSRGTAFLDGSHLITSEVVQEAERLAGCIPGFHYGRFDLRAPSEAEFVAGRGWQVLEVNGVNAEPAHIYQEGASLWAGIRSLVQHWSWACEISRLNRQHTPHVRRREAIAMCREWRMVKSSRWG